MPELLNLRCSLQNCINADVWYLVIMVNIIAQIFGGRILYALTFTEKPAHGLSFKFSGSYIQVSTFRQVIKPTIPKMTAKNMTEFVIYCRKLRNVVRNSRNRA